MDYMDLNEVKIKSNAQDIELNEKEKVGQEGLWSS